MDSDTNSIQQQKQLAQSQSRDSRQSSVYIGFFRFRFTSWPLITLAFGCGLLLLPPQDHVGKIVFGSVFLIYGILHLFSPLLRERYANGIQLKQNGFTVQRGLFGLRKQSFSYAGFLRIFELPAKNEMVLVFTKSLVKTNEPTPTSSLDQSPETDDLASSLIWLVFPKVNTPNFIPEFLNNVQSDKGYQQTADQLPDIDVLKAYQSYIGQPLRHLQTSLRDLFSTMKTVAILLGGLNSPLLLEAQTSNVFPAIRHSTRAAGLLLVLGIGIATLGSIIFDMLGASTDIVKSVRLLTLIWTTSPLVWLVLETYQQRAGVEIGEHTLYLRQPIRYFNRSIPYQHIMLPTALGNSSIAFICLKPRKVAPGDEPRPPRPRLLVSVPIEDIATCLGVIEEKTRDNNIPSEFRDWTVKQHIHRRHGRRAIFRRFILLVVLPAISFILFLIVIRIRAGLLSA